MKVGDLVRNIKFPNLQGIITDVSSYRGTITLRTQRDTVYSFRPEQLEVLVESR